LGTDDDSVVGSVLDFCGFEVDCDSEMLLRLLLLFVVTESL
jgi:hypothetical protein